MKLDEFIGSLVKDGIVVLSVSGGEVVDYLVSAAAARTLIKCNDKGIAAFILTDEHRILLLDKSAQSDDVKIPPIDL